MPPDSVDSRSAASRRFDRGASPAFRCEEVLYLRHDFSCDLSFMIARISSSERSYDEHRLPSPTIRRIVSLLLILHLAAIASAPWAMQPSSLLAQRVFGFFRPYLDAAYLNHGYHFFAPEPGPSHQVRYELEYADGQKLDGVFPNADRQTPRLAYHRHFMLTESVNRIAVTPNEQTTLQVLSSSFAEHLMSRHGAVRATLYLRRHYIPSPEQIADGLSLDAPELFAERPLGTFERSAIQ